MYVIDRASRVIALLVFVLSVSICGFGQTNQSHPASPLASAPASVDTVEFLKLFHIGMTYADVQAALPKGLDQDVPSYNTNDNVFTLGVGKSSADDWGAYFIFDTGDGAMRQPEHLIEIDCSATLANRTQDFDSLVQEVSGSYGTPVKLDVSAKQSTKSAGWRVRDDQVLTLEYTRISGTAKQETCLVDFVIRRLKYKAARPAERA